MSVRDFDPTGIANELRTAFHHHWVGATPTELAWHGSIRRNGHIAYFASWIDKPTSEGETFVWLDGELVEHVKEWRGSWWANCVGANYITEGNSKCHEYPTR